MLCFGMKHIAKNHGLKANVNYEENGNLCIYGGCNTPTLADVQFLCQDCKIPDDFIETYPEGIDVYLPGDKDGGLDTKWANAPYKVPYCEFWRSLS